VVAVACRAAGAGDALSADEGYSWLVASAPDADAFLDSLALYENTPPLFYVLLVPLPLDDEVWIRLPALIAGVASVPVLYVAVRPLLGERAALLAALGLAVAPYHVSFSNYARAFTLATLFLLLALWAVARLARGGRRRWWWLYALGAAAALYSQYYSVLFLLPLLAALTAARARPVREVVLFGLAPFLALLPWIGEIDRSRDLAGVTKVDPTYPDPSPGALRDLVAPLFFGEHGSAGAAAGRWLQLLAVAALLAAAVILLRRRARRDDGARLALWLFGGTAAGTLVLHGVVALAGPDVFETRYLTALVPLSAALLAGGLDSLPWRSAAPVTAAALAALGAAVILQRSDRELEPDYERVAEVVDRARPRTVLTNSAVVAYYLRDLPVQLDRPFNLGPGREARARPPYAVVDDRRVGDGPRPGPGRINVVEEVVVRVVASR
jgi:4-amino-4-deoxy-L-arabinose transferase-like glycosyltransferase